MWIKFDGKSNKVELAHSSWDSSRIFTLEGWVHIVETYDRLYIDGEDAEEIK